MLNAFTLIMYPRKNIYNHNNSPHSFSNASMPRVYKKIENMGRVNAREGEEDTSHMKLVLGPLSESS